MVVAEALLHSLHAYLLLKTRLYDDDNKKRNRYNINKLASVVFLLFKNGELSVPGCWSTCAGQGAPWFLSCMASLGWAHSHAFQSAALQWSWPAPQNKLCARLKYHILGGGRDYWNVANCRHSQETLIYRLVVLLAERHKGFIWLSSVSDDESCEGDRWFKRQGIEVFNPQVSISDSAQVKMTVKPCYQIVVWPAIQFPGCFFIHVTGLSLVINKQISNLSNKKSQCEYGIYFSKLKLTFLSWQQYKIVIAGSLCLYCLLSKRFYYLELLGWNFLLVSCEK